MKKHTVLDVNFFRGEKILFKKKRTQQQQKI